jgi:uncharacterized membrane protein
MSAWLFLLCEFSIISCAVVGGVFLTFSDFVMRSLAGADAATGTEVMQVINREVFRSVFMVLLLVMSALSPFLIGYAYLHLAGPASTLIVAGGAIYLVGVSAVTTAFNVPMNNRLAASHLSSSEAASYWKTKYLPDWTFWNSVRAIASVTSAICYLFAVSILTQAR